MIPTADTILYHGGCPDGFTAAWVAHHATRCFNVIPCNYGTEPPWAEINGKRVVIVDFSWPRPQMEEIARSVESARCFDHHKTAQAELEGFEWCEFDLEESGASLVWRELMGSPPPELVKYVRDRDLWLWDLPYSREISAWVMVQPHELEFFDVLADDLQSVDGFVQSHQKGAAIRMFIAKFCVDQEKRAYSVNLDEWQGIPCVNTTMSSVSDVLDYILQVRPSHFAIGWWRREDGIYQYDLRSRSSAVDVSLIAKAHGGGGHPQAAGFTSPTLLFP